MCSLHRGGWPSATGAVSVGGNLNPSPLSEPPGWVVGKACGQGCSLAVGFWATEVSGTWPAKPPMGLGSRGQAWDLGCCILERAALDHLEGPHGPGADPGAPMSTVTVL